MQSSPRGLELPRLRTCASVDRQTPTWPQRPGPSPPAWPASTSQAPGPVPAAVRSFPPTDPNTPTAQMPCADGHWPQGFLQGPSSVPPSPRPALGLCGPRPHTGKRRGPAGGPQHLLLCVMGRGPSWSLPTTTSSRLFRRQCPVPASTPASGPKSPPLGLLRNPSSPAAGSGKSEAPGPPGLH